MQVYNWCFPSGSVVKKPPINAGDARHVHSIPGSGRHLGKGNGNPLQYSCLGNPTDRGAWQGTVCRVTKESNRTYRLNNRTNNRWGVASHHGFNCSFLTCIHISQEAGKVIWYSHLFKNFSQFVVIHTVEPIWRRVCADIPWFLP